MFNSQKRREKSSFFMLITRIRVAHMDNLDPWPHLYYIELIVYVIQSRKSQENGAKIIIIASKIY